MMRMALLLVTVCACGGAPLLANAPKPNPAVVAGVAAAVAGAATLADPAGAAKRQEVKDKNDPHDHAVDVHETVPADVLDRLDQQTQAEPPAPRAAKPAPAVAPPPADEPPAAPPPPAALPPAALPPVLPPPVKK